MLSRLLLLLLSACAELGGSRHAAAAASRVVHVRAGASLAAAVVRSRQLPSHTVVLGAGVHRLLEPLLLTAADSGLTLRGEADDGRGGGPAVLDGGVALAPFAAGADGVWRAPLPASLFNASSGSWPTALFIDGVARLRARAPNALGAPPYSFAARYGAGAVFSGAMPLAPCSLPVFGTCPPIDSTGFYAYNASSAPDPSAARALAAAAAAPDAWVHMLQAWTIEWSRVASADAASGEVRFREPARTAVGAYGSEPLTTPAGGRWLLENARGLLDAAGEFFVDAAAGELLYLPLPGERPGPAGVAAVVPLLPSLITIAGAGGARPAVGIAIAGVTLVHTGEARGALARLQPTSAASALDIGPHVANITVSNVTLRDIGGNGIALWRDSRAVQLERLTISDVGGFAVTGALTSGLADLANFSDVSLSNSTIARAAGVYVDCGAGVSAVVGMRVTHNDIGWVPWSPMHAVFNGGGPASNVSVEVGWNRLHDYGLGVLSDMGGVYVDVSPKGAPATSWLRAHVHDNLVQRGAAYAGGYGANGLYSDDGTSGGLWERNVVAGVGGHGASAHCGVGTVLRNNLFVDVGTQRFTSDRALWGALSGCDGVAAGIGSNLTLDANVFELPAVAPRALPPKYAWLAAGPPRRTLASDRNVYHVIGGAAAVGFPNGSQPGAATVSLAAWRALTGLDGASVEADPRIRADLSLAADSPAWALGWQAIDIAGIGPLAPGRAEQRI